MRDDLDVRMKRYEHTIKNHLLTKTPVIIRIDGKAFHTFTRGLDKPFDQLLMDTMWSTTKFLCENIQCCKIGYTQSDEISLLLIDYENTKTSSWFEYNIQKMVSISSSIATLAFNNFWEKKLMHIDSKIQPDYWQTCISKIFKAMFDARAFNLPMEEVCNYFIWRQQDATRNSIQMVAQANFSHKQLQGLSCNKLQDKLFKEKGINWNNLPVSQKRGVCVIKHQVNKQVDVNGNMVDCQRNEWIVDENIPVFTQDRNYIDRYVFSL
jgi:tRNA(His) 5'-end guanylyltransferase